LYGTEFEIKLRNEMTQKAIARECADWIRRKATFKSNTTGENMGGFMTVEGKEADYAYMPINGFTTVDIGCERGNNAYNMVNRVPTPFTDGYLKTFEAIWADKSKLQDVTDVVIENIATAYNENSPAALFALIALTSAASKISTALLLLLLPDFLRSNSLRNHFLISKKDSSILIK